MIVRYNLNKNELLYINNTFMGGLLLLYSNFNDNVNIPLLTKDNLIIYPYSGLNNSIYFEGACLTAYNIGENKFIWNICLVVTNQIKIAIDNDNNILFAYVFLTTWW